MATYRRRCEDLIDHLDEVPGIRATVEHDEFVYTIPEAIVRLDSSWTGRSADEIVQALAEGDPPIYARALDPEQGLILNPFNPTDERSRSWAGASGKSSWPTDHVRPGAVLRGEAEAALDDRAAFSEHREQVGRRDLRSVRDRMGHG